MKNQICQFLFKTGGFNRSNGCNVTRSSWMYFLVFMSAGFLIMGSIFNSGPSGIEKSEWLIGTWENRTPRGTMYEQWEKAGKTELRARSFAIAENDTLIMETIRLVEDGEGLLYIPTVRNQNQGRPVEFRSVKLVDDEMIFSNPEHDFPQFISYTKISADSLVAAIYGMVNGQERRITFRMRKLE